MTPDARVVRIGTRRSRLALWQAELVAERLRALRPGTVFELAPFDTVGDRTPDVPLPRIGDRGLFTRDIEEALRTGAIDIAVHSLKDLPTSAPARLTIGAVLEREDPRDALVSASGASLAELPSGAVVGTSSLRRRAQLLALRADLRVTDIRGNVPTRIDKVRRGEYDATLLACAGLHRLGMRDHVAEVFEIDAVMPAPGQGALAVQVREGDPSVHFIVEAIDHLPTRLATLSERTVLSTLRGGCQAPLGALADWNGGTLRLKAVVASVRTPGVLRAEGRARVADIDGAVSLGRDVADDLRRQGAEHVLSDAREWVEALTAGDPA